MCTLMSKTPGDLYNIHRCLYCTGAQDTCLVRPHPSQQIQIHLHMRAYVTVQKVRCHEKYCELSWVLWQCASIVQAVVRGANECTLGRPRINWWMISWFMNWLINERIDWRKKILSCDLWIINDILHLTYISDYSSGFACVAFDSNMPAAPVFHPKNVPAVHFV